MAVKSKTLADADKKTLKELDNKKPKQEREYKEKDKPILCLICFSPHNEKISPEVLLDGLSLRQCKTCGERFYA